MADETPPGLTDSGKPRLDPLPVLHEILNHHDKMIGALANLVTTLANIVSNEENKEEILKEWRAFDVTWKSYQEFINSTREKGAKK